MPLWPTGAPSPMVVGRCACAAPAVANSAPEASAAAIATRTLRCPSIIPLLSADRLMSVRKPKVYADTKDPHKWDALSASKLGYRVRYLQEDRRVERSPGRDQRAYSNAAQRWKRPGLGGDKRPKRII